MKVAGLSCALLCALAPSLAGAAPVVPPIGAEELAGHFPDGSSVETRLDADIDGDGRKDVVAVGGNGDRRQVIVLLAYIDEFDVGYRAVGVLTLDPAPLGPAELKFGKGVLVLTDLAGGTTATQSVLRYRHDRAADRMRLIGDDFTSYSRTYAHGSVAVSTNRLTGARVVIRSELAPAGGKAALVAAKPVRSAVARTPLYMEETPDAETVFESVATKGKP